MKANEVTDLDVDLELTSGIMVGIKRFFDYMQGSPPSTIKSYIKVIRQFFEEYGVITPIKELKRGSDATKSCDAFLKCYYSPFSLKIHDFEKHTKADFILRHAYCQGLFHSPGSYEAIVTLSHG